MPVLMTFEELAFSSRIPEAMWLDGQVTVPLAWVLAKTISRLTALV
jgi:hypothetical protein